METSTKSEPISSEKIKDTKVIIVVAIVLLVISFALNGYLLYSSYFSKQTTSENENTDKDKEEVPEEFPEIGGDEFIGFAYNPNDPDAILMITAKLPTSRVKFSNEIIKNSFIEPSYLETERMVMQFSAPGESFYSPFSEYEVVPDAENYEKLYRIKSRSEDLENKGKTIYSYTNQPVVTKDPGCMYGVDDTDYYSPPCGEVTLRESIPSVPKDSLGSEYILAVSCEVKKDGGLEQCDSIAKTILVKRLK